ncbi:uncharacterized protein OCT59_026704 [Rhizophagus irregularis]|uniref:uncharacterized protein n=1 Tax=Rhizophagus irregularis TaxID=588596 RepID=UPI001C1C4BB5|nr:hypothetical protein OCT59_026704 [Rhizophagus irregularis]CAB4494482.1 unnamed protein product [Rhizophagus irregularis]
MFLGSAAIELFPSFFFSLLVVDFLSFFRTSNSSKVHFLLIISSVLQSKVLQFCDKVFKFFQFVNVLFSFYPFLYGVYLDLFLVL